MPNAIPSLFLLAAVLVGSVARVALGFLLGLERRLSRDGLLLLARDSGGLGRCCFLFAPLLFDLGGLAPLPGPLAIGYDRLALGAPLGDLGIIVPRLGSEFVQEILLRLLCRFLSVREAGFLKSAHRMACQFLLVLTCLPLLPHQSPSGVQCAPRRSHPLSPVSHARLTQTSGPSGEACRPLPKFAGYCDFPHSTGRS